MDKPSLIKKIKALDTLTNSEKADLIALLNNTKKYGLVWEDKPEDVERDLLTMLPILQEVPEKRILSSEIEKIETPKADQKKTDQSAGTISMFPDEAQISLEESPSPINTNSASLLLPGEGARRADEVREGRGGVPNHILIEGDNLHALTALTFTHAGQIDVMYFDPPYNTGNKDFKYNDRFVDKEDTYRHSKWLSFMHKRIELAKHLLSDNGIIFISIDDNEQAQLKMLCDEVFGEENFIETIIWKNKYGPGAMTKGFGNIHEYILTYTNKKLLSIESVLNEDEIKNYKIKDEYFETRGGYITQPLATKSKDDRPNLVYPIIHNGIEIWPDKQWIWSKERLFDAQAKNQLYFNGEGGKWSVRFKQYLKDENGNIRKGKPISIFIGPYNQDGTKELENLFQTKIFNNPKPTALINRLISMTINGGNNKNIKILDIFAGSGTTLHATMALNAEDGGSRQCILVTNNENNICEEVTYMRNKKVIEGYTNVKGMKVSGLTNNNLRYYKTGFVPSAKTETNRRLLTSASTELLQIKEDCYTVITSESGFNPDHCYICTNSLGKYLVIVFHSRRQHEVIEQLCRFIQDIPDLQGKVRVYAFSPETEVLVDDFYSVADKITAVPLPDAIYNAYRATFKTLKLEKKKFAAIPGEPELTGSEDSETDSQPELF